jgi:hypothetical protein
VSRDAALSLAIAVGALLTGFLFVIEADSWLWAVVTTLFLLVGPGLAVTRMLRLGDTMTEVTIAIATSLGLEVVIATALLTTGFWSPGTALAIVVVITLSCVVIAFAGQQNEIPGDGYRQAAESALGTIDRKGGTQ